MKRIYTTAAFVLIGVYFVVSIVTLPHYGVNWDETAHATRGQAYLYYFLTGKKQYDQALFGQGGKSSFYQMENLAFGYQMKRDGDHPVFSDIASSLFNFVFYQRLGILGDFESYHLYGVALVTAFLLFLYWWVARTYGTFAALVSVISLTLYPLFYGESHYNVQKDIPEAVYVTVTALVFYEAWLRRSTRWMIASGIVAGAALGTKLNIIFLSVPIGLWLFALGAKRVLHHFVLSSRPFRFAFFLAPIIAFGIFFGSWPWVWQNPVKNIAQSLGYYRQIGLTTAPMMLGNYYVWGFNTYAAQWIYFTTPIVTLILAVVGIAGTVWFGLKEKYKTSLYVLFLFLIPILRVSLPMTSIYGGVRQIMEYIPPMAMLAGVGAGFLIKIYKNYTRYKHYKDYSFLLQVLILLSFIPITLKMISMHPNESVYFNPIIGGLAGARERNIPGWGNSLGSTYRQGVRWINAHAEEGAKVAMAFELLSSIPKSDFRPDIKYSNLYRSGQKREGEYIIGITHQGDSARYLNYRYVQNFLVPLYQVVVDGVPLLKVWKNDIEHTIPSIIQDTHAITGIEVKRIGDKIIVEFPHVVRLTKLSLFFNERDDCTLPEEGQLFMSVDGQSWSQSAAGNLLESASYVWFKHHSEKGKLMYLFAADYLRYLKFTGIYEATCLHKYPVRVEAEGI